MDTRSSISPLLVFDDVWRKCFTKAFDFVKTMKHNELEELESLRVLVSMRTDALENRGLESGSLEDHVQKQESNLNFSRIHVST